MTDKEVADQVAKARLDMMINGVGFVLVRIDGIEAIDPSRIMIDGVPAPTAKDLNDEN